jgi:phosphoribosylpyrophosphate synthetase
MIKLNNIIIRPTIFNDKTSQVWKIDDAFPTVCEVSWEFESEAEFMHLAQLKQLMDTKMVKVANLYISYLPYARQDKNIDNSKTFALHTFSMLLNTLNFQKVIIEDVHSPVALELIKNSETIIPSPDKLAEELNAIVCFPDNGAASKYKTKKSSVTLEKTRNQTTGELKMAPLKAHITGNVLIFDDLCDKGGTFILAAKELYNAGANEVYLYVSHGIFSAGLEPLKQAGIKRIFTLKGEM